MNLTSSYPVLMAKDVRAAADFFCDVFGFVRTFDSDWYVSLRNGTWELAVLDPDHSTIPADFRGESAAGVLVNFEVADVDAVYADVVARGITPVLEIRSEDFGQRHFIIEGPERSLVDVITPITPEGEYVEQFLDT